MSLQLTKLIDSKVLVEEIDETLDDRVINSCILNSTVYDEYVQRMAVRAAETEFDATVTDFFAPILAAGEKLEQELETVPEDPRVIIIEAGTPGIEATNTEVFTLDDDGLVLHYIMTGRGGSLKWVDDKLVIVSDQPFTGYVPASVDVKVTDEMTEAFEDAIDDSTTVAE